MKRFDGRIALVTGASRGIGESMRNAWPPEGATVLAAARSADALARVVSEIEAAGGKASTLALDLGDARVHRRGREAALAAHGRSTFSSTTRA